MCTHEAGACDTGPEAMIAVAMYVREGMTACMDGDGGLQTKAQ